MKNIFDLEFSKHSSAMYRADFLSYYKKGRDFWRQFPEIQTVVSHSRVVGLLADLFKTRPLRLAFDQWLVNGDNISDKKYFDKAYSISDCYSVQGLVGGLCICLETLEEKIEGLPSIFGETLVFNFRHSFPFHLLEDSKNFKFLLVGYSQLNSVYRMAYKDPLKHLLKLLDYEEGDSLKDNKHPVVFV